MPELQAPPEPLLETYSSNSFDSLRRICVSCSFRTSRAAWNVQTLSRGKSCCGHSNISGRQWPLQVTKGGGRSVKTATCIAGSGTLFPCIRFERLEV